jgi:DNA-directed RNA polymerase subunit RPC12/RpoP
LGELGLRRNDTRITPLLGHCTCSGIEYIFEDAGPAQGGYPDSTSGYTSHQPDSSRNAMITVECQHCGAKLALDPGHLTPEVRCKRCGRRTSTAGAKKSKDNAPGKSSARSTEIPTIRPFERDVPPAPPEMPSQRIMPEEIYAAPRARPDFYSDDTVGNPSRTKVLALVGGAVAIVGGAVIAAVIALDVGKSSPTPYVGTMQGGSATAVSQANAQGNSVTGNTASATNTSGAPVPSAPPPPPPPPPVSTPALVDPTQPGIAATTTPNQPAARGGTGLAAQITATLGFNPDIYANSEIALADVEKIRQSLSPVDQEKWFDANFQINATFKEIMTANWLTRQPWLQANRPSLVIGFDNVPAGTTVKIVVGLRNKAAHKLLRGGQQTETETVPIPPPNERGISQVKLDPSWDIAELSKIETVEDLDLEVRLKYNDGTEDDRLTAKVRVHPASNVEMAYPLCLGFMGLVNEDHPYVRTILDQINQSTLAVGKKLMASGGSSDPSDQFLAVFLLWRELEARGLRYSSLPGTSADSCQAARSIHETLATKNANCVDGTILICSFLTKMGIDSALISPPGHALVVFWTSDRKGQQTSWGLETTMLGSKEACPLNVRGEIMKQFPGLAETYKSFNPSQRRDFDTFLSAVAVGENRVEMELAKVRSGVPVGDPPRTFTLKQLMDAAMDPKSSKEWKKMVLGYLSSEFMSITEIKNARRAGVRPIPVSAEMLAKYPLPPQPAATK